MGWRERQGPMGHVEGRAGWTAEWVIPSWTLIADETPIISTFALARLLLPLLLKCHRSPCEKALMPLA